MLTKVKFPLRIGIQKSTGAWHLHLYLNQVNLIKLGPYYTVREMKDYLFTQAGLTQAEINRMMRENFIEDKN
jgi:hypothetical protein